jgi:hypothetical protein
MRAFALTLAVLVVCVTAQTSSAKILHRWSFDKDSADTVGGAHAKLNEGAAVKDGKVAFDGQNNWIELPIGKTMEKLTNATFETWCTWDELQGPWARVFDFGRSQSVSLFFTVMNGRAEQGSVAGTPRFSITSGGLAAEQQLSGKERFPVGKETHVAVTIDADKKIGKLYIDGKEVASREMTYKPSDLGTYSQNWLAVSQYVDADPMFKGSITEFRIYDHPLTAEEIEQNFKAGPDKLGIKADGERPTAEKAAPAKADEKSKSDK